MKRSDSMLRTLSDARYMELHRRVTWDVRYKGLTYAKAADNNMLTVGEVNSLLNHPRQCVTS